MKYIVAILMLINLSTLSAQQMPERRELRRGNEKYEKEKYGEAIEHYDKAIKVAPGNIEPLFNMGNALIKSEKYEDADKLLKAIAADSLLSDDILSDTYYNLGNSQFMQQKYEEALESYKQSILLDPTDMEAKYNYAYTKAILNQQEQDQQDNQDNQDQQENQDQQDNQDQNQDQENQDQEQNQDQNQDQEQEQDQQPENEQEQEANSEFSEQQQNQMLDAIQAQEDKTQEDMKERAKGVLIPGAKNW